MRLITLSLAAVISLGCAVPSLHANELNLNTSASSGSAAALPVPDGYDLTTIGRAKATAVPGLAPDRHDNKTSTVISIKPSAGPPTAATIEWSGYIQTGIVFSKGHAQ